MYVTKVTPALILDRAIELCQEKSGYLGDHSQVAQAELSRCVLPKCISLLDTVSQFLCEENTRTQKKTTIKTVSSSPTVPA